MSLFDLLYYAAAAWYIAYVLTAMSGPFDLIARMREWRGGRWHGRFTIDVQIGTIQGYQPAKTEKRIVRKGLLDCIICLAIWVALVLRLIGSNIVIDACAIAGVGLWVHSYVGWRHDIT